MFAESCHETITYEKIEAPLASFEDAIATFFSHPETVGCNVTVPFKQQAFELSRSTCDNAARAAKAVNTLVKNADGRLAGHNTDGTGLVNDLRNQGVTLEGRTILLLGAGGAARGVIRPLLEAGINKLIITNRTHDTARTLASEAEQSNCDSVMAQHLNRYAVDIVINSTSASLNNSVPDCGTLDFSSCELAYDMVYGKSDTAFMQFAQAHGATHVADGLGMLVEQAAAAFTLWTGKAPETHPVISHLRAR